MFFILNTSLISSESATSLFTALFRDVFTQQYLCTLRVLLSAEFLLFQHKVWKRRKQNVIFNQIYFKALHYLKGKILNGHTWWTSIANLNEKTIKAIVKKSAFVLSWSPLRFTLLTWRCFCVSLPDWGSGSWSCFWRQIHPWRSAFRLHRLSWPSAHLWLRQLQALWEGKNKSHKYILHLHINKSLLLSDENCCNASFRDKSFLNEY